jgi:ribonuclease HIII
MMDKKPACFVTTIDLALTDKLRGDLLEQGFDLSTPQYTLFSAKKKGISCTLYESGKLTVQGKDKDEFITFYLEPEILKAFAYSYPENQVDLTPHIGIDEAGKGDFFGPLCIAGVQAGDEQIKQLLQLGVRDSKRMSDKTIRELSKKIKAIYPHSIVRISPQKYNELYMRFHNLNRLLAWGHATAIAELFEKTGCEEVLIDQFASEHLVKNALQQKKLSLRLTQRPRAEEDSVVAAASILARAAFLEGLELLSRDLSFPLPKGASQQVVAAGIALVKKHGENILEKIAKLHFKTREDILERQ